MKITNLLPILTVLVGATSCQFNYTFPEPSGHNAHSAHSTGHGAHAGVGYRQSVDACMLVKSEEECTDEEWVEEYQDIPGQGYYDGQWSADHVDEIAAQNVYQCDDGTVIIVDDNGDIIVLENPSRNS